MRIAADAAFRIGVGTDTAAAVFPPCPVAANAGGILIGLDLVHATRNVSELVGRPDGHRGWSALRIFNAAPALG